jgi:1-aminocyclopropane-1-carboxylate deaminase
MTKAFPPIPFQSITDKVTAAHEIQLSILRTDLNHVHISGNKLFKLNYNLQAAQQLNCDTILTFGGAYSNHIAATAAAGKEVGFKTIGIIRGDIHEQLNPTLQLATQCGMELHYVSRALYQDKVALMDYINGLFAGRNYYLIPEGGANELGVRGCMDITTFITSDFDFITTPCGTGTTLAGIILSLKANQQALGFQVLKAEGYIKTEVEKWTQNQYAVTWNINEDYHFGGYAKRKKSLIQFVDWFQHTHTIPLDYVYTGKMMFGIYDLIQKGFFKKGTRIVAVHTGGLQGNSGFEQ